MHGGCSRYRLFRHGTCTAQAYAKRGNWEIVWRNGVVQLSLWIIETDAKIKFLEGRQTFSTVGISFMACQDRHRWVPVGERFHELEIPLAFEQVGLVTRDRLAELPHVVHQIARWDGGRAIRKFAVHQQMHILERILPGLQRGLHV